MKEFAMIHRIAFGVCAVLTLMTVSAQAQDIDDLDEGVALETPFELGIEPGVWELGVQIGYIDFSSRLVAAEGIIIDLENAQDAIFADMELVGDSSFQPLFRLNRSFGSHFEFVNSIGFALGDYTQKITGPQEKWKARDSSNTFTDVEVQTGSYFMWRNEHGITYYPRGRGMVQPFFTAGIGSNNFSVDSEYISGTAGSIAYSWGGGLRIVADDLFSLTLEVRNYHTSTQFEVADNYKVIPNLGADGLISFPTSALADIDDMSDNEIAAIIDRLQLRDSLGLGPNDTGADIRAAILAPDSELPRRLPRVLEGFEKETYSSLWISFGFVAAF
jgi:hypothetical protein